MAYKVTLQPFGVEFSCNDNETVLEAAFRAEVSLRYGCKHGGCGGCKAKLVEGFVDYSDNAAAISEAEKDAGITLLCCAYPDEDIVIQLGDDYTEADLTPEFPLQEYRLKLVVNENLTADIRHLVLDVIEPVRYGFRAGQFLEVKVPGTDQWRAFSMANSPADGGRVELVVKQLAGGLFGDYLSKVAMPGDELIVRGPYGQFCLFDTVAPIVMVAGGSGVAPIMSMIEALVAVNSPRAVHFFFGARSEKDLYWLEKIAEIGNQLTDFTFTPALSEPEAGDHWQGERGLITEVLYRLTEDSLRGSEGYLCGPPGMIDAAIEVLKQKGMFGTRIAFDKFLSSQ
ncbi:MAG: 2Fe-2S iron-sulfur cluster-binding protein [Spongiibacteraceae bacterium]